MDDDKADIGFATKAVHSGTNSVGGGVNTPVFLSSTYHLTDEDTLAGQRVLNTLCYMPDYLA